MSSTEPSSAETSSIESYFLRYGPAYRWIATGTVMIATIAVVLSTTIVNVAFPAVMRAFDVGQVEAQWLSTGFLAAMTATMLLTDWLDKALGPRWAMNAALIAFLAGSALGGFAPNEQALTLARVIQGAAAGVVQPLAMVVLFRVFPPQSRGGAMGVFGLGVVLAPAIGPWVGGVLVDAFNWRYVFFLGAPFAAIGVALSCLFLPGRAAGSRRPPLDWRGALLLCVFLAAFLDALTSAERLGWGSDPVLAELAVSALAAAGFIWWELRVEKPMLDLRVFLTPAFAAASAVAFVLGVGLFGSIYLAPLFVQTIQGFTPTRAGLLLMPAGFVLVAAFPVGGRLADRLPIGPLIAAGMAVFAYSAWLSASVRVDTAFWTMAWWIMLSRLGLGLVFPALTTGSLQVLPRELVGQGAGVVNFIRQLGGAFGVNLLAVLLERRAALHADALAAARAAADPAASERLAETVRLVESAAPSAPAQAPSALWRLAQELVFQAKALAFQDGFLAVAVVFLAALLPTWILHRAERRARRRLSDAPRRRGA